MDQRTWRAAYCGNLFNICKKGCSRPWNKLVDILTSASIILAIWYLIDVSNSAVSIAMYYRTNRTLNNYAYAYNQVFYPLLFAITIWSVYFFQYLFIRLRNKRKQELETITVLATDPLLDEDDSDVNSGDSASMIEIPSREKETSKTHKIPEANELSLRDDINMFFRIYAIMAMSDTFLGMAIIPAILYLDSTLVLLFGRIILPLNMLFSCCFFKRKYTIVHYISVLLIFVGISFVIIPTGKLDFIRFASNGSLPEVSSDQDSSLTTTEFALLLLSMLIIEAGSAASSIYKEHVLKKYKLKPLRVVAVVATIQIFFSSPTIILLSIPLPAPWFYVPFGELGPYLYNATMIMVDSFYLSQEGPPSYNQSYIAGNSSMPLHTMQEGNPALVNSTQRYFFLFYLLYLFTNVLANIIDIIFIQEVSSTFNIIVNVSVIVTGVFSLGWAALAGEAQTQITIYTGLALFFIVIATVLFKSQSNENPDFDTMDPAKKIPLLIERKPKGDIEKPKSTSRKYNLREDNPMHSNVTILRRSPSYAQPRDSKRTLAPDASPRGFTLTLHGTGSARPNSLGLRSQSARTFDDISLTAHASPPSSTSQSGSELEDILEDEKEDGNEDTNNDDL